MLISNSVLEHLESPRNAMKEMASLLKPGGLALLTCIIPSVIQEPDWKNIQTWLLHGQTLPKEINPWEHLNYFTIETLSRFLAEFGFTPVYPGGKKHPQISNWHSISGLIGILRTYTKKTLPIIPEYWVYQR